jgi:uncharacterized membrane protein
MLKREEKEMQTDNNSIVVSVIYIMVAVGLTVWLARTLFHSGTAFLRDVFEGKPELADALNRLLVTGFYMLSLGYALYILRASRQQDGFQAVQFLVNRLAMLLVTLALIHFVNVAVFWKIRTRREQRSMPRPVAPQARISRPSTGYSAPAAPQAPPTPPTGS